MSEIRKISGVVLTLAALLALGLTACEQKGTGGDDTASGDNAFRNAVPNAAPMMLDVPNDQGTGQLVIGERAELYAITRNVSVSINTYAGVLLTALRLVVLLPPSERGDDYRVWGPTEPKGLEAFSWRLRVDKESDALFAFSADSRPKGSVSDDDFLPMISGTVTPGAELATSKGSLTLNFDNYQAVGGPDPCPTGLIHLDWDASASTRTVEVRWEDFKNTCNQKTLTDVTYRYSQNPDFSGQFEFQTTDNIHQASAGKPESETLLMKSRWQSDGSGRSDVTLTGNEIVADFQDLGLSSTDVQVTQCWDNLFNLTYADSQPTEFKQFLFEEMGNSSDCVFDSAEYPTF